MGTLIAGQSDVSPAEPEACIALFFIPLEGISAELQTQAMVWLSEDERAKVARYRAPKAQMNALLVRAALRAVLSTVLSTVLPKNASASAQSLHPKDWCFEYGPRGKPSLTASQWQQTGLDFNVSHSGDWLLIGVTKALKARSVLFGVDIERSRPKTDIYPILNHYFSPQETATLLTLADEPSQRQRFFDLWALKESYIKATGLGLAQSLKSFSFDLKPFEQLVAESVELRCQDAALMQSCGVANLLSVYPNIPLQTIDASSWYWQTYFGRLTEEYRFAVSLGHTAHAALPMGLTAQLSSIETLLADYY